MNPKSTEERFIEVYSETFYQLLLSIFTSKGKISDEFYLLSVEKQRELEREARRKALSLALGFVERMKQKGFLDKQPSERELGKLFHSYLEEAGNES